MIAIIQDVSFGACGGVDLLGDSLLLPPVPGKLDVTAGLLELTALAVEEEENVVLKYGKKITKLLAVRLVGIGIGPKIQKCSIA